MRSLILAATISIISLTAYAGSASSVGQQLGQVWKSEQSLHAKSVPNEFAIVYGGEDIDNKSPLSHQVVMV